MKKKNIFILLTVLILLSLLIFFFYLESKKEIEIKNEIIESNIYQLMNKYKIIKDKKDIYLFCKGDEKSILYKKINHKFKKIKVFQDKILDLTLNENHIIYVMEVKKYNPTKYIFNEIDIDTGDIIKTFDLGIKIFRDWTLEKDIPISLVKNGIFIYNDYFFKFNSYSDDYLKYKKAVEILLKDETNKNAQKIFESFYLSFTKINSKYCYSKSLDAVEYKYIYKIYNCGSDKIVDFLSIDINNIKENYKNNNYYPFSIKIIDYENNNWLISINRISVDEKNIEQMFLNEKNINQFKKNGLIKITKFIPKEKLILDAIIADNNQYILYLEKGKLKFK